MDKTVREVVSEVLADAKLIDNDRERAKRLMTHVMKTWNPPRLFGDERPQDFAQTSVMLTIAYIMGREFLPNNLTENQQAAIDSGLGLLHKVLDT